MPIDDKLTHAREFTDIEDLTLDLWLQLENAGLDARAASLLDAGLMFEHYTSLLDNDPGKRSVQEINQQAQLGFKLTDQVRQAQSELSDLVRRGRITNSPPFHVVSFEEYNRRIAAVTERVDTLDNYLIGLKNAFGEQPTV